MEQQLAQAEDEDQEEMRIEEEEAQRGETQNKHTPQKTTRRRAATPESVQTVLESPPPAQRSPTRQPGTPVQQLLKTRAEEIIKRPSPSRSPLAQRQDRKRAEERAKQQEEDSYNAMTAKLMEDERFYLETTLNCSTSTPPELVRAQLDA